MNIIYVINFSILSHFRERKRGREKERERARQLQMTVKPKHTFAPIGRAIFSRIWGEAGQLQVFGKIKHACIPIGLAIFNFHYFLKHVVS
jgi:hypothetical protein